MSTFAEVPSKVKRLILIKPKYDACVKDKTFFFSLTLGTFEIEPLDDEIFLMKVLATVSHIASFYPHFPAEKERQSSFRYLQ